jgi:hypothetical protein
MKTAIVPLFLAVCLQTDLFAAPVPGAKIHGNWLAGRSYGMSFYRIRRNGEVDCFYRSCTNPGTRLRGHYTRTADTIALFFPNDTTVLFLDNGALYPISEAGKFSTKVPGLERTHRSTIRGAERQLKRELRKRRRQYEDYIDEV